MEIYIKEVMRDTTHLWCRWHIFKDARTELGTIYRNNSSFRDEFHKVITEMLTVSEFRNAWRKLLKKYNLTDNAFMVRSYDKREKWQLLQQGGYFVLA